MIIAKFLRTAFFMKRLRWLVLQVLYKKAAPKNFANFNRTYRYRSPFSSSSRIICNFVKVEDPAQVFCWEFCEIHSEQLCAEQL